MKRAFGVAGLLAVAGLFVAHRGHATPGWVQIPGLATQIAVGANDIPYILDINGYVQYLAPSKLVCSGSLCVQSDREWVFTNIQASRVAADQYGYLWMIDAFGALSIGGPSPRPFDTSLLPMNVANCVTSLAPGRPQLYPEWNYPFGLASRPHFLNSGQIGTIPFTTSYITGCGSPSLSSIDLALHDQLDSSGNDHRWITSTGWHSVDTGEVQVSNFTVDGSATQIPWILAPLSNGVVTAWAHTGPNSYIAAPPPTFWGIQLPITYITDHFIVAANVVWSWQGDAYGKRGTPVWRSINNSPAPSGATIAQIASSNALPGTAVGTIGPSHLYMIDSNNNIYQWGDVAGPVK